MRLTDDFERLRIDSIIIRRAERQRRVIETKDLEESIRRIGLLKPIIVERTPEGPLLRAGERRLTASKNLGEQTIIARWIEDLSPIEAQIVELEENVRRQDLEWKDLVTAIGRIHDLHRELDGEWTGQDTADAIGLKKPWISECLKVYRELEDPRIRICSTVREAYNILCRRDQRASGAALEELLSVAPMVLPADLAEQVEGQEPQERQIAPLPPRRAPLPEPEAIICADFLEWAPRYEGPKFDFIHCDFPYGTDVFAGPMGRGSEERLYTDTADTYWTLLECFCQNLDRFMTLSGHLMFWYSRKWGPQTEYFFAEKAPSLTFGTFDLIWHKTDNSGIASDPRFTPRHVYETCLIARRSNRHLIEIRSDVYGSHPDKRLHVSTKPKPMVKYFMEMFCDANSSVFDPTCGSGAALRAADEIGCRRILGLEIDPKCAELAAQAFRTERAMRRAEQALARRGPTAMEL